jgi:hypothetical protein
MGTNRRYADRIDQQLSERVIEMAMREHAPTSLTDRELELSEVALTKPPKPRPARAWVRYGGTALLVDVEVVAWTEYVVAVRWTTPSGREDRAWVWSSAVRPR